jgi:hypothetical protein
MVRHDPPPPPDDTHTHTQSHTPTRTTTTHPPQRAVKNVAAQRADDLRINCCLRRASWCITHRLSVDPHTHPHHTRPRAQNCRSQNHRIPDSQTVSMMILVTPQNDGQCDLTFVWVCVDVRVCGVVPVQCLCACLWVGAQCQTRRLRHRWPMASTRSVRVQLQQDRRSLLWHR